MSPAARLCTFIVEPLDTLTLTFLSSPSDSTAAMALPAGAMVPPRSAVPMVSRVGSGSGAAQPGSSTASEIANFAMSFVGYSYVWGGKSPSTGFDCSGLMYYVLTNYGYKMNRVANDQMSQGTYVSRSDLQVGDLVFFGYGNYANHVGMYIGGGNFVHASTPSTGVRINSLDESYYKTRFLCGRRII